MFYDCLHTSSVDISFIITKHLDRPFFNNSHGSLIIAPKQNVFPFPVFAPQDSRDIYRILEPTSGETSSSLSGRLRRNVELNQTVEKLWKHAVENKTKESYDVSYTHFERFMLLNNVCKYL
jgi:hypothetical protein